MKQRPHSSDEELKHSVIVGTALLELTTPQNILLFVKTVPDGEAIPAAILLDMMDLDLRSALADKRAKDNPNKLISIFSDEVTKDLNDFKKKLSGALETLKHMQELMANFHIDKSHRRADFRKSLGNQLLKVQAELKESNKPHELGTVDEIAKRYGISKSEVRRHKAAGTLNEYVNSLSTVN